MMKTTQFKKKQSELDLFHLNLFNQIDRELINSNHLNAFKSLGLSPFQKSVEELIGKTTVNSLNHLVKQIQDVVPLTMKSIINEVNFYNRSLSQSLIDFIKSMNYIQYTIEAPLQRSINETIKKNIDSISLLNNYNNTLVNSLRDINKVLISNAQLSSLTNSINKSIISSNQDTFSSIIKFLQENKLNPSRNDNSQYTIENDTILIEKNKYSIAELKSAFKELIEESGIINNQKTLDESLSQLNKSISEINDNKLKTFLLNVVSSLLASIIFLFMTPQMNELAQSSFKQKSRTTIKKINEATNKLSPDVKEVLKDYRIIKLKALSVFISPKQKSKKLGFLYFGQIVKIIDTKKSWALVQLTSDNDSFELKGWVFSRYLKNLK